MECPNCKHDNKEGATFCERCGAQLESEKKRLSFFERRQAKERERQYIISKASLQEEDVKDIRDMDMGEVEAVVKGDKRTVKRDTTIRFSLSIVGVIIAVALIYIVGRAQFNDTARVTVILALFLLCFTAAAFAIDYGYRLRMINAMCKSSFAVKKISYGKPPVMLLSDKFYELKIKTKCDLCGAQMHIEEYNGEFIAVCNADRAHLRRLDAAALNVKNSEGKVQANTDVDAQADETKIEEIKDGEAKFEQVDEKPEESENTSSSQESERDAQ
ncbi:MAG: zinc ribbon domain-containing protein [Clostridia bacterium]|nr:zinc ribbon domain-containing protein [Clostridia bacterium]MDE7328893.1 zinc ribbon domain-containing protein [Clostridia bacterium]